eukprot:4192260-Heterocapsa_arctica.AAC.1
MVKLLASESVVTLRVQPLRRSRSRTTSSLICKQTNNADEQLSEERQKCCNSVPTVIQQCSESGPTVFQKCTNSDPTIVQQSSNHDPKVIQRRSKCITTVRNLRSSSSSSSYSLPTTGV